MITIKNLSGDEVRQEEIRKVGTDPILGTMYLYNGTGKTVPTGIEMIPDMVVRVHTRTDGNNRETVVSLLKAIHEEDPIPERDLGILIGRVIKTDRAPVLSSDFLTVIQEYTEVLVPGPQVFLFKNGHFIEKSIIEPTWCDHVWFL